MRISSRFTFLHTAILAAVVLLRMVQAVEVTAGPEVLVTESSARIKWQTDVEAGTRVSYGTNEKLFMNRAQGNVSVLHEIELQGLLPGTVYYFTFGTARVQLGEGKFTTAGGSLAKPAPAQPGKKTFLQRIFPKLTVPSPPAAPPTAQTWAHADSLLDHFERHGGDFKATSPDDYAAQAWQFLQRAKRDGLPMKWDDADSSLRVFDPKTRAFASYDRHGKTRTYFKPGNPNYWASQPGRAVTATQLGF